MRIVVDLAVAFLMMGAIEAVIKPIAKRFVQRRLLAVAPAVLALLDQQMPQLLGQLNGEQLELVVRRKLESLTGESWSEKEISQLFELYDPRITANQHFRP
jgi:hypothetical protein